MHWGVLASVGLVIFNQRAPSETNFLLSLGVIAIMLDVLATMVLDGKVQGPILRRILGSSRRHRTILRGSWGTGVHFERLLAFSVGIQVHFGGGDEYFSPSERRAKRTSHD